MKFGLELESIFFFKFVVFELRVDLFNRERRKGFTFRLFIDGIRKKDVVGRKIYFRVMSVGVSMDVAIGESKGRAMTGLIGIR